MDGEYSVRITSTRSGLESRGVMKVAGLEIEGTGYILLVGGSMGSLLLVMLLFIAKVSWLWVVLMGLLPFAGALSWHLTMVQGKPPAYSSDFFSTLLDGKDFFTKPLVWTRRPHPLGLAVKHKRHGR